MPFHRKYASRNGVPITIIVRPETEERLKTTCFRGTRLACAGNFSKWNSVYELFDHRGVLNEFIDHLAELYAKQRIGTASVQIVVPDTVGWSSTDDLEKYDDDLVEFFRPNRRSSGLRVKRKYQVILAPKTNKLTIVFELKLEDDKPVAIVHSIYPGEDIGELRGQVSFREGVVFFDFQHPGA